jgi:hypothetical protein
VPAAPSYSTGIPVPPIGDLCHYISHFSTVVKTDHLIAMILSFIPLPIWFTQDSLLHIRTTSPMLGFLLVDEDGHLMFTSS